MGRKVERERGGGGGGRQEKQHVAVRHKAEIRNRLTGQEKLTFPSRLEEN